MFEHHKEHPKGVLSIHELMRASKDDLLSSVMHREVVRLPAALIEDDLVKNPYWRQPTAARCRFIPLLRETARSE